MAQGHFSIVRSTMPGVEAVVADSAHAFGRHMHDQFGVGVIVRGAQKSLSGRGTVEAKAGDIITVNPGEVHDGTPLDDHGRTWQMLYFDPAALADTIRELTEGATAEAEIAHPTLNHQASAARFLSLFRAMTDPKGGHSEIETREHLLLILAQLLGSRPSGTPHRSAPRGIEHARARIDDDPSAPISLGELSALGGLSQFQLVRGFAKATGFTPHAYLVQRRLQKARRLMAAGLALAEVAHAAGFADQSHLTRLFARTFGMTPGQYAAAMK